MSNELLLDKIAFVTNATSEQDLLSRLKTSVQALGFDQFLLGVEVKRPLVKPIQHVCSGYKPEWQRLYLERGYISVDPTVHHCQTSTLPMVWNESHYDNGSRALWEEARSHGIAHGLSLALHDNAGVKSMFSLARDKSVDKDERELASVLTGAKVLATCAHFAATQLLVPGMIKQALPPLTAREVECLNWSAKGKTAVEIGMILHISEATAVFHLSNVVRKFGVSNRIQAIAMGVSLGLVS